MGARERPASFIQEVAGDAADLVLLGRGEGTPSRGGSALWVQRECRTCSSLLKPELSVKVETNRAYFHCKHILFVLRRENWPGWFVNKCFPQVDMISDYSGKEV